MTMKALILTIITLTVSLCSAYVQRLPRRRSKTIAERLATKHAAQARIHYASSRRQYRKLPRRSYRRYYREYMIPRYRHGKRADATNIEEEELGIR